MSEQELRDWGEAFKTKLATTEALLRGFEQALVDAGVMTPEKAATWPA